MSLTAEEQQRTCAELRANLALTGLADADVAAVLGFSAGQLAETLALGRASQPADVWLVRDYLEQRVLASGRTPVPFTVLTEQSRQLAAGWFRLRQAPGDSVL